MLETLLYIFLLSCIVGSVSITLTKSGLFKGVRLFAKSKSDLLGSLMTCPYCMSHWISACVYLLFKPSMHPEALQNFILCEFLLVTMSSIVCYVIYVTHANIEEAQDE